MDTLQVPDSSLKNVELFCNRQGPYHGFDEHLFVLALKESILWHQERNIFYSRLLEYHKFDPNLLSIDNIDEIPFIIATFFKKHRLLSIDEKEASLHLTSSGTTGQKSEIFFDDWSIGIAQNMLDKIFEYYGWITPQEKCNYLLYSYAPKTESDTLGTAYTDNYLCKYVKAARVHYALRVGKSGKHDFDLFGCIDRIIEFAKEGLPVRIFGFPAFLYFTLEVLKERGGLKNKLHPNSLVFLGGGWKGNGDKEITKSDLYHMVKEVLGIPDARIRDGFGSVEHCIPYVECSNHKFHEPIWSKVIIRDVKTLRPVKNGAIGYLSFLSPYITSVPANNVLMTDLAVLNEGDSCQCELTTPYFEVLGRAGISKNRSCAIAAAEMLEGKV